VRIVIAGAGGRLGAALAESYRDNFRVIPFDRKALDLADPIQIAQKLDPLEFDVLINCAALTNVDYCETHSDEALGINARAVATLAHQCQAKGARLVQISTDYVFDGDANTPYREDDLPQPISIYGSSKLAGENEAMDASSENLIVRVSWVFGPHRPSFIDAVIRRALTSDSVDAIADKFSTPAYTIDIAESLKALLSQSAKGIFHVCNTGQCSWRDYGEFALECAAKSGLPVLTTGVRGTRMAEMKSFIARRPVFSVLSTEKLEKQVGHAPRSWQDSVAEYVAKYADLLVPKAL
jgi:dTDP-4-dehydrorhamnose reductase